MKAAVITQPGAPDVLQWKEYTTPVLGDIEVLIDVKAAGINRADILQRQGNYPPPPGVNAEVPGLEVAGVVVACGAGVSLWKPGDEVCAIMAGGGYASQVAVKEGQCLPVPDGLSFAEAASLPETVFTVWSNVFQRARLQPGETLLVHGGASGIGITAIQLAHALGSRVIVTVGEEEKGRACMVLGADRYVNYKTDAFEKVLADERVDVILDMVGGDYLAKNVQLVNEEGRIVYINAMEGSLVQLDLWKVMQKRIAITGSTLRGRPYAYKHALADEVRKHVWPLIASGAFKPVIYQSFPFEEVARAHALMEAGRHIGKLVLVAD
ncbi:putative NAD(P)H quinone oxidoreductase, PIG3 family [Filimonas lacunae]|uniref:Putative NAD(P)H quinone oxidoreductase, PIG3 family n=1 Tax=Filimonas lacunae TaxID=477680 RepID=A0A173MIF7_9BACT|nr:NAD(P)H-quinone oxidoreductase [Filimonas lacunae]BAV07413.1 quinone oxidoreductase [Filimonas lacunae]SIT30458.1 putative NAD(P)H quinone oxidoreductase, PIG3 family [Filimonas lacunae]